MDDIMVIVGNKSNASSLIIITWTLTICLLLVAYVSPTVLAFSNKLRPKHQNAKYIFPTPTSSSTESNSIDSSKQRQHQSLTSTLVLVDVENVRGKSGFKLSHESLFGRAMVWHSDKRRNVDENIKLGLIVDHGGLQCVQMKGQLEPNVYVVFSGPKQKADDVIVTIVRQRCNSVVASTTDDDVRLLEQNTTIVITADRELISRCQHARCSSNKKKGVHSSEVKYIEPKSFLDELEQYATLINDSDDYNLFEEDMANTSITRSISTTDEQLKELENSNGSNNGINDDKTDDEANKIILQEIEARKELLKIDKRLNTRGRNGISRKQRTKLKARRERARERLIEVVAASTMRETSSGTTTEKSSTGSNGTTRTFSSLIQNSLNIQLSSAETTSRRRASTGGSSLDIEDLAKIMKASKGNGRGESTYERTVLAERLRRRLHLSGSKTTDQIHNMMWLNNNNGTINKFIRPNRSTLNTAEDVDLSRTRTTTKTGIKQEGGRQKMINPCLLDSGEHFNNNPTETAETVIVNAVDDEYTTILKVPSLPSDGEEFINGETKMKQNIVKPVRIVVISDTHGMHHHLSHLPPPDGITASNERPPYMLPDADILIHAGDFCLHKERSSAEKLDAWLSKQTHIKHKIVVRGNHDLSLPGKIIFPKSKAIYATEISTLSIEGIDFCLVPYTFRSTPPTLPKCDVLVSHVPPLGVLDLTYDNVNAGSKLLRNSVERSEHKPRLWLCGHIHEARGAALKRFADRSNNVKSSHKDNAVSAKTPTLVSQTLVVNAANANPGRAKRLVAGSMLVDVDRITTNDELMHDTGDDGLSSTSSDLMKLDEVPRLDSLATLAAKEVAINDKLERKLLAVDLGLRTAFALFDSKGKLIQVGSRCFDNIVSLEAAIPNLLHNASHVVVEGANAALYRAWSNAITPGKQHIVRVTAEEWRETILLPKERQDKRKAKTAARAIAKQIVNINAPTFIKPPKAEQPRSPSSSRLSTDEAEAILVGYHAVSALGWTECTTPNVRRYSNGNVVSIC